MSAKSVSKVISEDDCRKLQKLYYRFDALNQLVIGGVASEIVLERYEKAYSDYQAKWNEILSGYFDIDLNKGNYSWNCSFNTREVTVLDNKK